MPHANIVEIFGSVTSPDHLPTTDGPVRLLITAKAVSASSQRLIAYCSCQLTGSPMPFNLRVDRSTLAEGETLTLQAGCGTAPGEDSQVVRTRLPVPLDGQRRIGPLTLQLEPVTDSPQTDALKMPIEPVVISLSLSVVIPEALVKADTHLDVTLLRVQQDGQSNRVSSNIAGASMQHGGNGSPFTLYLDANVLTENDRLKLHVAQYNQERSKALAGYVVRDLGPNDLRDFGEVILRAPRQ
ncbi:hypothetical protein KSS93_23595 [Pseudomonas xanthosomatis]|uniref:hypothetical protein n=1 Tax=Pseudomonas xanthosomatis TaxID=2842356 RepID=UPI001C3D04CA|nr:hypothetical protein [Pseudomonas xanthosomatis]QXH45822.1 hypothetical protein KSS93_23595 [Pseudomonas xanthosomatis]